MSLIPLESTRYCILLALAKEPMYGLAIHQQVLSDSRGGAHIDPSTIYKALTSLEKRQLIAKHERTDDKHTRYKLTPFGYRILKAETIRLQDATQLARERNPA